MAPAFIFDLDGTLIDSRRSIAAACNHALVATSRSPLPEARIAGFVGDGARTLLVRASGLTPDSPELEALLAEFVRWYAAHPVDGTTWMPGALEILGALAAHPLGLVTNKTRAVTVPILDALGVRERFGVVVAGGDGKLKPDPQPIRAAMTALGASPADTWVVGDGVQDVRAGRAAGCRTAAVLGGFHSEASLRAEGPDVVLASLADVLSLEGAARPA